MPSTGVGVERSQQPRINLRPCFVDHPPPGIARHRGFTLLELMLTVTVLAVLVTLTGPSMQQMLARNRLKTAAQALVEDMQWTRGEAIRRNLDLYLTIDVDAWCYGISTSKDCDCRLTDPRSVKACTLPTAGLPVLKTISGIDYPGIRISGDGMTFLGRPPQTSFKSRRGTAQPGGLTLESPQGAQLRVILSIVGRVRLCTPSRSVAGYRSC
jgi:type IV fimbrial biogenesis protein FimT